MFGRGGEGNRVGGLWEDQRFQGFKEGEETTGNLGLKRAERIWLKKKS